jgi:hypothetical protein
VVASATVIRNKVQELGTVTAPDEKSAIAAAEFRIPPERRNRIVVAKVSEWD